MDRKVYFKNYIMRLVADGKTQKLGKKTLKDKVLDEALNELVADGKVERYDLVRHTKDKTYIAIVYVKMADGKTIDSQE